MLLAVLSAWLLAHLLKVAVASFRVKRFEWRVIFFAGGMPSAHTTLVSALATSVWLEQGPSELFLAVVVFGGIVAYDAMTLRRTVEEHAGLLRKLYRKDEPVMRRGGIGHSAGEVFAGLFLGVLVPLLLYL